ncbi:MAG: hypothetical protein J0H69_17135 [Burkholderiales bacterium]|nr:hypothetical protein [Burkholderiales bacterium]
MTEPTTSMDAAARRIQAARDSADLSNHRERLVWLSGSRPVWSDGTPVDAHTRHALIAQSESVVARLTAQERMQ